MARRVAMNASAQRDRGTGTDHECPKALLTFKLCAAALRGAWSSQVEVVLLFLCLGLALARGLRLSRPLGRFARSASATIARHVCTLSKEHPYQQDSLPVFYRLHRPEHFSLNAVSSPCLA
jgi:hypothetical protein